MDLCDLLLARSRPSWQLVKASSASSTRILRAHTSLLVDDVQNNVASSLKDSKAQKRARPYVIYRE
jgi:hypothetical protein